MRIINKRLLSVYVMRLRQKTRGCYGTTNELTAVRVEMSKSVVCVDESR